MIAAPTGTSAWRRLETGIWRLRREKTSRRSRRASPSSFSGTPIDGCDRLAGDVVLGRAEAAADEDGVGPTEARSRGHRRSARRCRRPGSGSCSRRRSGELLGDPGRVRVDDLAEEQLGPDRDDLGAHRQTADSVPHLVGRRARPDAAAGRPRGSSIPVTTVSPTATHTSVAAHASGAAPRGAGGTPRRSRGPGRGSSAWRAAAPGSRCRGAPP